LISIRDTTTRVDVTRGLVYRARPTVNSGRSDSPFLRTHGMTLTRYMSSGACPPHTSCVTRFSSAPSIMCGDPTPRPGNNHARLGAGAGAGAGAGGMAWVDGEVTL
jgi:hypothetical protein